MMKPFILFVLALGLFFLALLAEGNCKDQEKRSAESSDRINQAQGNLRNIYGSGYNPEISSGSKVSRVPVLILGGLGGMIFLAALISLGSAKKLN